jgi:hypothetical protein
MKYYLLFPTFVIRGITNWKYFSSFKAVKQCAYVHILFYETLEQTYKNNFWMIR